MRRCIDRGCRSQLIHVFVTPVTCRCRLHGSLNRDQPNVGHLPARRVSCCIKIVQSEDGELADFPIDEQDFFGSYVLTPGAITRQGSDSITLAEKGYIYVWGRIRYLDGFDKQRTTDFCHRYPRIMLRRLRSGYGIPAEFGRFHSVGNSTDED
jgi:hypothetical protein